MKSPQNDKIDFVHCIYCYIWTYYTHCSGLCIIDIEQVNAGWVMKKRTQVTGRGEWKTSSKQVKNNFQASR